MAITVLLFTAVFAGFIFADYFVNVENLRLAVSGIRLWAIPIYVGLQVFQGISIVVPLTPLTLAGGLVFGPSMGFFLSWIGVVGGQMLAFVFAKVIGSDFVHARVGNVRLGWIQSMLVAERLSVKGLLILWLIYFSCVVSFDIIAYSLGLTRITARWMFLISSIGIIPKLLILSVLGDIFVARADKFWLLIAITLLLVAVVSSTLILLRRPHNL